MSKSLTDLSRTVFNAPDSTFESIATGCLQRIADATEKMAVNWTALTNELNKEKDRSERYLRQVEAYKATLKTERKRVAALRGVLTRMKRSKQTPETKAAK